MDARGETLVPVDREQVAGVDPRPRRLRRRVAHRLAHQRLRRRPPRARDRRPGRGALPGLPGDDLLRRAAGVPRVRAHADRVHELLRAPAGRRLRATACSRRCATSACARELDILRSDAGVMTPREAARNPVYGVLSGPSGGVAGALHVATRAGFPNVLTFDMGGTSTDVVAVPGGRADDRPRDDDRAVPHQGAVRRRAHGRRRRRLDRARAAAHARAARRAGVGGRRARPGGLRAGGEAPTVTDANVVVGHLPPRLIGGEMELDADAARTAVAAGRRGDRPVASTRPPRASSRSSTRTWPARCG